MAGLIRFPDDRRVARTVTVAEGAMELQAALQELRERARPLWAAAEASGRYDLLSEATAITRTLRVAEHQARRLAGMAEAEPACPDGIWALGHGRAA